MHNQGKRYVAQGRELILIGHAGHPEVEGTLGQIDGPVVLVQNEKDVDALDIPAGTPVAYVTQTTLCVDDTQGIIAALEQRYHDIVGPETRDICYATQNRQSAVRELSHLVDVILVVGAKNSSNSNRLREIGEEAGIPSYLIADGSELAPEWVKHARNGRHHRRRLGAGGAGRGRDQHIAKARRGRSLDAPRPGRADRVPAAPRPGDGLRQRSEATDLRRSNRKTENYASSVLQGNAHRRVHLQAEAYGP